MSPLTASGPLRPAHVATVASRPVRGALALATSALCLTLAALAAKLLSPAVSAPQLVFLRSLVMVAAVGLWARGRGEPLFAAERRSGLLLLLRGVLGTVGAMLFFGALRRIPLGDTMILFQSHPALVAFVSPWILGERLRPWQLLLVLGSIGGVALVVGPEGGGDWIGRGMALGCAVTTGLAVALVRLARRELPALTVAIAFPAVAVATIGPAIALRVPWFSWGDPTPLDWGIVAAIAALGTIAQVLQAVGLGCMPAARGAPISNLQVVFAVVLGYLLLDEVPTATSLAGAALIVVCLLLLSRERSARASDEKAC